MIKVCDAIMGSGKSSAAITYINEHPDKRFIYITPYLDEAKRIARGCAGTVHLYEPRKTEKFHGSKTLHTIDHIQNGRSVATTHQAFRCYPRELLELIAEKGYTLIIDESLNLFESIKVPPGDMQMVMDAGYVELVQDEERDEDDVFRLVKGAYEGCSLNTFFRTLQARDIIRIKRKNGGQAMFFWLFPPELFLAFEDVIVLTYQFEGQSMSHFFQLNNLEYSNIGIDHPNETTYRFSESGLYVPEYVSALQDKIHILDKPKLNAVGQDKWALSMAWFSKDPDLVDRLKKNVYNYFSNIARVPLEDRLWGTYKDARWKLRGSGYWSRHLPFNRRATNDYRNCTSLAYCSNVFMNVTQKQYYHKHGIDANEDLFALSTMVQWIWRSAIRDGKEITIYIPSHRMRELLEKWIQEVSA